MPDQMRRGRPRIFQNDEERINHHNDLSGVSRTAQRRILDRLRHDRRTFLMESSLAFLSPPLPDPQKLCGRISALTAHDEQFTQMVLQLESTADEDLLNPDVRRRIRE